MVQGSMVALVTPMRGDGSIDVLALDALVDWHLDAGSDAIVAVGTTGESATLDVDEHLAVIGRVVERASGRIPVIAGTGANSTREAIELTREAHRLGANFALLVTPYYNKPTQEGLYRHFHTIADAVEIPQILYNVPGRTAVDLLPDTVARLAPHPGIIGIKDATGDLSRLPRLIDATPDDFALISGDDATACSFLLGGGHGVISVTANVAPGAMHAMCAAAAAGDAAAAHAQDERLSGLHHALFLESNPIPVKWALHRMGCTGSTIRLPLTELSSKHHDAVEAAIRQAGIELESNE